MRAVQSAVLHALERAVEKGERHEAQLALRKLDPVIRWRARSVLLSALRFADLNTAVESESHRLRVAGLRVVRVVPEEGYEDEADVRRLFGLALESAPRPRRGPWLVVAMAAAAVVLSLGAFVAQHLLAPFDPKQTPAGYVLGPELTAHLVVSSHAKASERPTLRQKYLDSAEKALPGSVATALDRTLRAYGEVLDAPAEGSIRSRLDTLVNGVVDLDEQLGERRLPFFVDADWSSRGNRVVPYLLTFYVERERWVEAAGQRIRIVHLWRLDQLAVHQGYLGYTRPHTPAALVLLDQVEADLIGDVLPALPPEETMELVDFKTRLSGEAWIDAVEAATASAVRRHFAALPVVELERYLDVGELLAARRRLVRSWRSTLSGLGTSLVAPRRLIPEADYLGELEHKVPRAQLREWKAVHDRLLEREPHAAFEQLRNNYVAAVERHEVQHRIDYRRELFEVPPVLVRRLAVENPLAVPPGSLAARARDELSAYLASIASAEPTPLLELTLLARFLFDSRTMGGPYSYAALGVYEAIAEELTLLPELRERKVLRRTQLAALVQTVLAQDAGVLRDAARAAYIRQFQAELTPMARLSDRSNETWLH